MTTTSWTPETPTTTRAWHAITTYLRERQALGLWSSRLIVLTAATRRSLTEHQANQLLDAAIEHGYLEQRDGPLDCRQPQVRLVRRCRTCGCTDNAACTPPCWWVTPDLCSACE